MEGSNPWGYLKFSQSLDQFSIKQKLMVLGCFGDPHFEKSSCGGFQSMGVPLNHPDFNKIVHYKPAIWGTIFGNLCITIS